MAQEILKAIGVAAPPLVIAEARAPPHQESFALQLSDKLALPHPAGRR
jgi:hypothetical protein